MQSRITFLGHPLHAMLVVLPLGLLLTSFLFDLLHLWRREHFWRRAAFWLILVGTLGAGAAVATGLLDYLSIPMPRHARTTATRHLVLGLTVATLYGLQLWLRRKHAGAADEGSERPGYSPALLVLAVVSVAAVAVQGWLGGELSHVHGVGVVAERSRPDAVPVVAAPGESPPAVSGREVYRRACAGCHGEKGEGQVGPGLAGTRNALELEAIVKVVRRGKPPLMPGFAPQLSPEEIAAVAAYVYGLRDQSSRANLHFP